MLACYRDNTEWRIKKWIMQVLRRSGNRTVLETMRFNHAVKGWTLEGSVQRNHPSLQWPSKLPDWSIYEKHACSTVYVPRGTTQPPETTDRLSPKTKSQQNILAAFNTWPEYKSSLFDTCNSFMHTHNTSRFRQTQSSQTGSTTKTSADAMLHKANLSLKKLDRLSDNATNQQIEQFDTMSSAIIQRRVNTNSTVQNTMEKWPRWYTPKLCSERAAANNLLYISSAAANYQMIDHGWDWWVWWKMKHRKRVSMTS